MDSLFVTRKRACGRAPGPGSSCSQSVSSRCSLHSQPAGAKPQHAHLTYGAARSSFLQSVTWYHLPNLGLLWATPMKQRRHGRDAIAGRLDHGHPHHRGSIPEPDVSAKPVSLVLLNRGVGGGPGDPGAGHVLCITGNASAFHGGPCPAARAQRRGDGGAGTRPDHPGQNAPGRRLRLPRKPPR